jgi:uncharacterized protein
MKKLINLFFALCFFSFVTNAQLKTLPLNEISLDGWMKDQLARDISTGYISIYDELQPTMQMDVFGPEKAKNYSIDQDGNWIARRETWWPGEHEGYYADLMVRSAFLTGHQPWLEKSKAKMDYVIKHQEPTGYIGIYDEETRLDNLLNENGEFWSQSRILGALLAYYEYSGKKIYFDAAKKAMDYTIYRYQKSGKTYFNQPNPNGGGLTHGLMIIETLEWFYKLTKDKKYLDFAFWVYEDYSAAEEKVGNTDSQLGKLLDRELMFEDHAVHTCEHYRVPLFLAANTKNPLYKKAVKNAWYKMKRSLNPSGAIATDVRKHESVAFNYGSPDLPFEYCTITELLISFASGMEKKQDADYGDMVERLTFNAAQGSRIPDGSAIIYLGKDNQKDAVGKNNFRYQYAACHRVACCNLQAGKIIPYYAANMWMKSKDNKTIYATLLGASSVSTKVNGVQVNIQEATLYPFENTIKFTISPEKKRKFTLAIRNPSWSKNTKVKCADANVVIENGFIYVTRIWDNGDVCEVVLEEKVEAHRAMNNEFYFSRGALMYSLPIEDERKVTQEFDMGLKNWDIVPKELKEFETISNLTVQNNVDINLRDGNVRFEYIENKDKDINYPFDIPFGFIKTELLKQGKPVKVDLHPYGSTILRKTTFKEGK